MAFYSIVIQAPGPQGPSGSGSVTLGQYDIRDYGAISGAANNTAAIQATIDALPSSGGVIYLPPGNWLCTSGLDLNERRNVIFQGNGGTSGGAQTRTLLYTSMTGTGSFLDCTGTTGIQFRDMEIGYTSSSYTGRLIDFRQGALTAAYGVIDNCLLTGIGAATAVLLDFDEAIFCTVVNSVLAGADIGARGLASAGRFSNGIRFIGSTFNHCTTASVMNPGNWQFISCGFEGSGATAAHAITHAAGVTCRGLLISGCWSGDTTGGTTFKLAGKGITITGNYIGSYLGVGIDLDEVCAGVVIEGNEFDIPITAMDFSSLAHTGVSFRNNGFTGAGTEVIGAGSIVSGVTQSSSSITFYGETVFADGDDIGVGTSSGTKLGTATTQKLGFWNATPVVRPTGWASPTGTATRTAFDTNTVNVPDLAEVVKALVDDLTTIGLIGT